jgi:hypothetical protein
MDRSHFLQGTENKHQFSCEFRRVRKQFLILEVGYSLMYLRQWSFRTDTIVKKSAYHKFDNCVFCLVSMKKDIHENKNILSYNVL